MHFHKDFSGLHFITSELEEALRAKCTGERSHNGNAASRSLVRLSPLPDAGSFGSRKTEWRSSGKQVLQQKVNCRGGSTPSTLCSSVAGGLAPARWLGARVTLGPGSKSGGLMSM
jgi:hypothetical protein